MTSGVSCSRFCACSISTLRTWMHATTNATVQSVSRTGAPLLRQPLPPLQPHPRPQPQPQSQVEVRPSQAVEHARAQVWVSISAIALGRWVGLVWESECTRSTATKTVRSKCSMSGCSAITARDNPLCRPPKSCSKAFWRVHCFSPVCSRCCHPPLCVASLCAVSMRACIGDLTLNGLVLSVPDGHVKDEFWAKATFTSPSIHYAASQVYASLIECQRPDNTKWNLQIVLQIRQSPGIVFCLQKTGFVCLTFSAGFGIPS